MTDTASPHWLPGRRIDAYVLLREIARGGMGEIWLALDRSGVQLERLVVIKRVLRATDDDPQHVALFLDEARIASQLQHPNVVQVFTMGEADGAPYLVMEYLPGQSLGRVVRAFAKAGTPMPLELGARIIADAAKGLGYAHRRRGLDGKPLRIVHRDVSPQNLLVTYDGHVKVLDFGIAVAEGRMSRTATGVVRGKIAYMAPEQAQGEPLGAQADVFALGVMLWELSTARRLHGDADDLAVLRRLAIETTDLPDIRRVLPEVEPGFADLVATALKRVPQSRFADGLELAEALERWLVAHPPPMTLSAAMERVFGEEIRALPELQRAVTVTPSVGVDRDMPSTATRPVGVPFELDAGTQVVAPPAPEVEPAPRRVGLRAVLAGLLVVMGAVVIGLATRQPERAAPVDAGVVVVVSEPADAGPLEDAGAIAEPAVDAGRTSLASSRATLFERIARLRTDPSSLRTLDELVKQLEQAQSVEVLTGVETELTELEAAIERRKKQPRAEPVKPGQLSLDTEPWSKVYLGKKFLGETPLVETQVPSGALRLHLVNDVDGIDTYVDVKVAPGVVTTKQYRLK